MAVKKYTNRPDVAMQEGWDFWGPKTTYDRFGDEAQYGYAPPPGPIDYGAEDQFGYAPAPTGDPYGDLRATSRFKSNRAMGGRDVGAGYDQYPKYGDTTTPAAGGGGGGGGGGGTRYKPSVGRVTTQKTAFEGEFPEAPKLAEMDKRRVKALTQKAMAPRLRLLRSALNRALVRSYENPNVRRMIVREALQGYGQGVEEARAGAERGAMMEEREERGISNQNLMIAYQNALAKYKASGVTTTTQRDIFDPDEARGLASGKKAAGFGGGYTSGAGPLGPMKPAQRRSSLV